MIVRFSDWFMTTKSEVKHKVGPTGNQCFLVSIIDAKTEMGDCVLPSFRNTNEFGQRLKNFTGSYEMWFDAASSEKIMARIEEEFAAGNMLCFEFVPSMIRLESEEPIAGTKPETSHKLYQTITISDDRYAEPRRIFSKPKPSIAGL